jgi:hypothetical protein
MVQRIFFAGATLIGMIYTHVSEMWMWHHPNESHSSNLLFQQYKTPSNLDMDCIITVDFFFCTSVKDIYKLPMPSL